MSERYSRADIMQIAEDLIEDLRECDDGTVTTTSELAVDCGYTELDNPELLELHAALSKLAKANRIKLDSSELADQNNELPYDRAYTVKNQKAQIKCPFCGCKNTARYIYGLPLFSLRMQKMLDAGKWALGGCCISSVDIKGQTVYTMPKRNCNYCHKDFATNPVLFTPKRNTAEDYRDIVGSINFSIGGYFGGYTSISIKKNNNGALVSVDKPPQEDFLLLQEQDTCSQISHKKWDNIVNTLYSKMYLHEWKKHYDDSSMLDGTSWSLEIRLKGNRKRHYSGINDYPPYWDELIRIFRRFTKI